MYLLLYIVTNSLYQLLYDISVYYLLIYLLIHFIIFNINFITLYFLNFLYFIFLSIFSNFIMQFPYHTFFHITQRSSDEKSHDNTHCDLGSCVPLPAGFVRKIQGRSGICHGFFIMNCAKSHYGHINIVICL